MPDQKTAGWPAVLYGAAEMLPLMVFVLVRSVGPTMPQRIFVGAILALGIFLLQARRRIGISPLYAATNGFFVMAAVILLLPFEALATLFLDLGEIGMFITILMIALAWHAQSPAGLFPPATLTPLTKKYSRILLGVYALCPAIALYFKGNENLAGALPFIFITVAEKALIFCQAREMKRNLQYAE